jgi:hypothetical protein
MRAPASIMPLAALVIPSSWATCQRSLAVWTEAMLLLRAALATLFDELVAAEVAVDHQVLIT